MALRTIRCPHCGASTMLTAAGLCANCKQDVSDLPPTGASPQTASDAHGKQGDAFEEPPAGASPPPGSDAYRDEVRRVSLSNMRTGALWLAGGVLVTWLSYRFAGIRGGGHYVVASGAMLYGAIRLLVGWSNLRR